MIIVVDSRDIDYEIPSLIRIYLSTKQDIEKSKN